MGIKLLDHNQAAYEAVLQMLADTGRAAVIHPTGTGKSFIALKLCEDHPQKTVCWLSPSEHIFKTQQENWEKSGGRMPGNIRFFTYARLMLMGQEDLKSIGADYLVLDEFHRCGARMWGSGVERFLQLYPDILMLGLSATNIRYLDNQRDMADELFDGNVASEMTLGDAIVRGILNPPKYVLSVYSYQKGFKRYEKRVRSVKNKAVREESEKYLEALRHALDKADGVDEVFYKHMTVQDARPDGCRNVRRECDSQREEPAGCGKYIVFCANVEHLREMVEISPDWFHKVDPKPHIYTVYSHDPETTRAFADFKADDSRHLKLLFCINMLNEGIHVDDVDGVILLRPTVSPIVYKQQIGRALSTGGKNHAVIFDIVMNIENLYSIGAIEEEMQTAMAHYQSLGLSKEIVNEHFNVIDEVRECMELFERLNDSLSASWETMYELAKQYYEENGNLNVPKRYVTEEGFSLGQWLNTQRRIYAGKANGTLTALRIKKLEDIGMCWESFREMNWDKNYTAAKAYAREHGNLLVSVNSGLYQGVRLGNWLAWLRTCRKNQVSNSYITPERIAALDAIGMVWDVPEYLWEQNYSSALQYFQENGNLDVPCDYVDQNGVHLGTWITNLRSKKKSGLTEEQTDRLNKIGMVWKSKYETAWDNSYAAACEYKKKYGDLNVPTAYVTEDGCPLGRWIRYQRSRYKKNLGKEQKEKLDAIGMVWETEDSWEVKFALAKKYYQEHGNLDMPKDYVVEGVWLSRWLNGQSDKSLTPEQRHKLMSLGMTPGMSRYDLAWKRQYEEAEKFYKKNGHLNVPKHYTGAEGKDLSTWLTRQKEKKKNGRLEQEQVQLLSRIGMEWESAEPWQTGFEHAEKYFAEAGNLCVPTTFICADGYRLGKWIQNQRSVFHKTVRGELSREQIGKLNGIGMIWDAAEYKWQVMYEEARVYYQEHGNLNVPRGFKTSSGNDLHYWLETQKKAEHEKMLDGKKEKLLNAVGIDWRFSSERQWEDAYLLAVQYQVVNGDLLIPGGYKTRGGYHLGRWIRNQRVKRASLGMEQVRKLDAIGMVWDVP